MTSADEITEIFFPLEVFYPSQAGGTANVVYWTTKYLAAHNFRSVIVSTDKGIQPDVPLNKWIEIEGGKTIYVKTKFLDFPVKQTLISLLRFYRSDIVQISSIFFPTAFFTAIACRILRKKMVLSPHGELSELALRHSSLRKRPILWCLKKVLRTYPFFHSTSDAEIENIKAVFGENVRVALIHNFIELPQKIERNASNYLLYIGRIHPHKAIDNLIRAAANSGVFLKSDFILRIAGTGKKEYEDRLVTLISSLNLSDKIVFTGHVEGDAKQRLIADAYFTILPSHSENFGMVVLESLAQETPVVASKGSPWKSLEHEKVGFWSDNAPEHLAKQIDKILQMPAAEYGGYRARSRKFAEENFDIKTNIGRWVELYRSL